MESVHSMEEISRRDLVERSSKYTLHTPTSRIYSRILSPTYRRTFDRAYDCRSLLATHLLTYQFIFICISSHTILVLLLPIYNQHNHTNTIHITNIIWKDKNMILSVCCLSCHPIIISYILYKWQALLYYIFSFSSIYLFTRRIYNTIQHNPT